MQSYTCDKIHYHCLILHNNQFRSCSNVVQWPKLGFCLQEMQVRWFGYMAHSQGCPLVLSHEKDNVKDKGKSGLTARFDIFKNRGPILFPSCPK